MKREMICIICPKGCAMTVDYEGQDIKTVTGNTCKRGEAYAVAECLHPVRTVTTTMRAEDGSMIPVKTDRPIPKEKIMELMNVVNRTKVDLPITVGDVIIKDIYGANVVATCNRSL